MGNETNREERTKKALPSEIGNVDDALFSGKIPPIYPFPKARGAMNFVTTERASFVKDALKDAILNAEGTIDKEDEADDEGAWELSFKFKLTVMKEDIEVAGS